MIREQDKERFEEMLNEYYERYDIDFRHKFYLEELIKLKIQYTNTFPEHIRARTDLMQLILELENRLNLKEKTQTIDLLDVDESILELMQITTEDNQLFFKLNMSGILRSKLSQGAKENKLIDVTRVRGVGKTYELVSFAKDNNYIVIVPNEWFAKCLREERDYDKIYGQRDNRLSLLKGEKCVVDEYVDINKIKNKFKLNIVTGYIDKSIESNKLFK